MWVRVPPWAPTIDIQPKFIDKRLKMSSINFVKFVLKCIYLKVHFEYKHRLKTS